MSHLLLLTLSLFLSPQSGPEEQYQFVIGLAEKGLHDQVIREAGSFLTEYPDHPKAPSARYRLASSLYELDRYPEAADNYRPLTKVTGFDYQAESALRLAQCEMAGRNFTAAAAALELCLTLDRDYLEQPATFLLSEAWFRAGEFAKAAVRYQQVVGVAEYAKDSLYGLAWCAFRLKNMQATIDRASRFVAQYPGDDLVGEMQFLTGEAYLEAEQAAQALASYTAVRGGPFADAALRGAGFAAASMGNHQAAAGYFGQLVLGFPDSRFRTESLLQQGIHLLKADHHQDSLIALSAAELNANPDALYWRAQAQQKTGLKEEALKTLEAGLSLNPPTELRDRLASTRGDILFDLGRHDEATVAYGESQSDYSLHAAAVASLNAGQPQQAVEQVRRLLTNFPDSPYAPKAQLALGEGLLQLKEYAQAQAAFATAALASDEANHRSRAWSREAWCFYLQKDLGQAASAFARVYTAYPQAEEAEEAFYMHGRSLVESENEEQAAGVWLAYVEHYPESPRKAELLLRLGRMSGEEGMKHLEQLIESYGGTSQAPRALMELGEMHYQAGRLAEAESAFTTLLTNYPDDDLAAAAGYGLGWCLYDTERFAEAADILRQVAAVAAQNEMAELNQRSLELQIWAEQKSEDPEGALDAFNDFAASEPGFARVQAAARAVADVLNGAGMTEEASNLLSSVAAEVQDPVLAAETLVEVVYLELDRGNRDGAHDALFRAANLQPQSTTVAEAAFFTGESWFEVGELQNAVDCYTLAATVPGSRVAAQALYKTGFALLRADNVSDAALAFGRVVAEHEDSELHGESTFLYGEALFRLGRYQEAASQFAALRSKAPLHQVMPKNLFRLGIAEFQLDRFQDANDTLTELVGKWPDFPNATEAELWRGRSLAALGKRRAAEQAFERVTSRDKGVLSARALIGLGKLAMGGEEFDAALSHFLKVAVLYGTDAEVAEALYYSGICLEQQGNRKGAAKQYNEILTKYPDGPFAEQASNRLKAIQ